MKRKFRITRSVDFRRVRRFGRTYTHPLMVLITLHGDQDNSRAGFITGKSIGNAVKRNRARRQLRAVFSALLPFFTKYSDLVFIAREPIVRASYLEIFCTAKLLLSRAELVQTEKND